MTSLFENFAQMTQAGHPNVLQAQLVRTSDEAAILIASFSDGAAMADFSSSVAGPWFAEHFRQFLGGPADRRTDEIIAGFVR